MTIAIPLTRGYETIIDDEDADLAERKWFAKVTPQGGVYACRTTHVNGKRVDIPLHLVILERKLGMPLASGFVADHRDRNSLNNQRSNLRAATRTQNNQNKGIHRNNISGTPGVVWNQQRSKWAVYISLGGKTKYIGLFTNKDDAVSARHAAEKKYFGEFSPSADLDQSTFPAQLPVSSRPEFVPLPADHSVPVTEEQENSLWGGDFLILARMIADGLRASRTTPTPDHTPDSIPTDLAMPEEAASGQ